MVVVAIYDQVRDGEHLLNATVAMVY